MKVRELVAQLQQLDPELDLLCCTEDDGFLAPKHAFRLLDILATSIAVGEMVRGDDQVPSLKLGNGPHSRKHAILEVTSEF